MSFEFELFVLYILNFIFDVNDDMKTNLISVRITVSKNLMIGLSGWSI